jgi:hypothetical protein
MHSRLSLPNLNMNILLNGIYAVFRRVRKIAKSDYQLRHVRPSAWNSYAPTGRILMKF